MSFIQAVIDAFRSSQYRSPTAVLPIESRAEESRGLFSFGVPWPWYLEAQPFKSPGALSSIQLLAPRAGTPATITVQVMPGKTEIDERTVGQFAKQFARQRGGKSGSTRRLRIGGLPAIDFTAATGTEHHRMIVLPDNEVTVEIDAVFPLSHAAGYGSHLDSMLATWSWH